MMEVYNEMKPIEGKKVCLKGWEVCGIKGAVKLGVTKLPNLGLFDDIDLMLEKYCNDIPVTDSSAILRAVSYIPSDHEIGGSDDDEEWIDEQNEGMFLHFLLMIKIFESEKIFVAVCFIATTKKY